jgi:hypothetical protein
VVLPEPVSPQTITTWFAWMAAMISSRRPETGSDSGNSMRKGAEGVVVVKGKQSSSARGGQTVDYRRAPVVAQLPQYGATVGCVT